jgi:hypothetical protein
MSFGQLGCQLNGLPIGRYGTAPQPLTVERNREVIVGGDDPFFEDDRELKVFGGLYKPVAAQQREAERGMRFGVAGIEPNGLPQGGDGGR